MKSLISTFCFLLSAFATPAVEYFASTTGSSGNDGSLNSPWSLKHALTQIVPGITITVLPGVYVGGTAFYVDTTSGTPANPATVRSQTKWGAVIANSTNTGFQIFAHNIALDGFCISNSTTAGFEQEGYSNTIKNCWFVNNGGTTISSVYSSSPGNSNNIIENCLIEGSGNHSLYISGPNNIVRNNVLRNGRGYGIHFYTGFSTLRQWDNLIYNNLTYGHTNHFGAVMFGAYDSGTAPGGNPGTNIFIGNTILDGLELAYGTAYVSNNIILPNVTNPTRPIGYYGSFPTITRSDYNLSTVAYLTNGVHDVITNYAGFVNTNKALYWLKADSPARGAAKTTVFGPVNFFGQAQSSVSDIGAFQYSARYAADSRTLSSGAANFWATNWGNITVSNLSVTTLRTP